MSEFRFDPLTCRRIIVASDRAQRPHELSDGLASSETDPFLEGRESETPPEVFALRSPDSQADGPDWSVRVVPNRYPALQRLVEKSEFAPAEGIEVAQAHGCHEVVIECPHHERRFVNLGVEQITRVVDAYRQRFIALADDKRLASAILFKNEGTAAGASLAHCHSQIMALPIIPEDLDRQLTAAARCRPEESVSGLIERELAAEKRIVLDSPDFVVICPAASRFAWETWIIPKRPESHFESLKPALVPRLAEVLYDLLRRIDCCADSPPLNFVLYSAAFRRPAPQFRWRLEVFPRTAGVAGFELGTGIYINVLSPEDAARQLRSS